MTTLTTAAVGPSHGPPMSPLWQSLGVFSQGAGRQLAHQPRGGELKPQRERREQLTDSTEKAGGLRGKYSPRTPASDICSAKQLHPSKRWPPISISEGGGVTGNHAEGTCRHLLPCAEHNALPARHLCD
ncbi:hypothetical protein SKAU_G00157010 [Synaphobranchus kaupii]|uniref:Uncharacterized protein n=1 Tax=Synaphobranchus kaupii TaxID=118154 RepID=A0A9Q1IYH1_SYNKA|nr:hypothetical protein SKAU_G00157010 [Synaphobranchus kaupii]